MELFLPDGLGRAEGRAVSSPWGSCFEPAAAARSTPMPLMCNMVPWRAGPALHACLLSQSPVDEESPGIRLLGLVVEPPGAPFLLVASTLGCWGQSSKLAEGAC